MTSSSSSSSSSAAAASVTGPMLTSPNISRTSTVIGFQSKYEMTKKERKGPEED